MQMLEPLGEAVFKDTLCIFCRCNAARFENGMALLPKGCLKWPRKEHKPLCHYCSKEYHITQIDQGFG